MTLDNNQLTEFRMLLETERIDIQRQLHEHGRRETETGAWVGSSAIEGSGEETDRNDVADQIEVLVTNIPLVHELENRLQEINDALAKIKLGTYGICEVSGEEIPIVRLMANPAARTTIAHAQE